MTEKKTRKKATTKKSTAKKTTKKTSTEKVDPRISGLTKSIKMETLLSYFQSNLRAQNRGSADIIEQWKQFKAVVEANYDDIDVYIGQEQLKSLVLTNRQQLGYDQADIGTMVQRAVESALKEEI